MRKKGYTAAVLICLALSLTACGPKNMIEQETAGTQTEASSESGTKATSEVDKAASDHKPAGTASSTGTSTENTAETTLDTLASMLGMTDEKASDLLGGGEENRTEDKTILIGRVYETVLAGNAAAVHTMYSDQETVDMVQAEIRGMSIAECQKWITESTGSAMLDTEEGESGQAKGQWDWNGSLINLYETEGAVFVELFTPVQ